jgi:heme exporter protein C
MTKLEMAKTRLLPVLTVVLLVLLAAWVVLAPAETQLGNVIKVVYVHGALVWVGLLTFSVAGILGLVALLVRRPVWYRGTQATALAALITWIIYVISSMAVTGLAWGQLVAWNEPRVQATALIFGAAIVLAIVTRLVGHPDFTAVVNLLMGIVPWIVVQQADAIRHPIDPIGSSESSSIQVFYLLIVLTIAALAATLIAWLWLRMELETKDE